MDHFQVNVWSTTALMVLSVLKIENYYQLGFQLIFIHTDRQRSCQIVL